MLAQSILLLVLLGFGLFIAVLMAISLAGSAPRPRKPPSPARPLR